MGAAPRIVFVQYTNPAGYPPLEHAALRLAREGWEVTFLGAAAHGADALRFAPHVPVAVQRLPSFGDGLLQRLNYAVYLVWVIGFCLLHRPRWVYASDAMAALPALAVRALLRCRVVYHEHDIPAPPAGRLRQMLLAARARLARVADICVLPQQERLARFLAQTRRTGPACCVWNCPRLEEVSPPRAPSQSGHAVRFHYHGSINRARLPVTVLDALARASPDACLTIVGYETIGSRGHVRELREHARRIGLERRVEFAGAMSRSELMTLARTADVGLSFVPAGTADANLAHLVGASNKPFDYLSAGMALLVSDLEHWRGFYVSAGCAIACDPADVENLAAAMAWCCANPDRVRDLGEAGRQRILAEWNYERQFQPVLRMLAAGLAPAENVVRGALST